jgi:TetR/AcrR family transcriptional regulator
MLSIRYFIILIRLPNKLTIWLNFLAIFFVISKKNFSFAYNLTVWLNQKDNIMDRTTEEKIYEAARRIFILKGMEGARMQEIADEAGMNKALLHYYFRSKENLFKAVFKDIFTKFFLKVKVTLFSEISANEKINVFIDNYIDLIQSNPYVPQFIINEINRDPKVLSTLMSESGIGPQKILSIFLNEVKSNNLSKLDPRHIVVSLLGMLIFPFVARPLLQMVYFNDDKEAYNRFLNERKEVVKNMIFKFIEV